MHSLISVIVTGLQLPRYCSYVLDAAVSVNLPYCWLSNLFHMWWVLCSHGAVRRFVGRFSLSFTNYLFFRVHQQREMEVICWFPSVHRSCICWWMFSWRLKMMMFAWIVLVRYQFLTIFCSLKIIFETSILSVLFVLTFASPEWSLFWMGRDWH